MQSAELSAPLGPAVPLDFCPGSTFCSAVSGSIFCVATAAADSFVSFSSTSSPSTSSAAAKGDLSVSQKFTSGFQAAKS